MKRVTAAAVAIAAALTQAGAIVPAVQAQDNADQLAEISYNYDGSDHTRMMEKLDRGLVAVSTDSGVYLSWRLLGTESSVEEIYNAPDFEVYRNGEKIADVENSTNYIDTEGSASDTYTVSVTGGEQCEPVSPWSDNYTEIILDRPEAETIEYTTPDGTTGYMGPYEFTPADTSCGDLDGDGQYELVIKWVSAEKDVGSPGDPAYSGTVRLAAYELTGEKMWDTDINLGKNVYSSAHTVQFLVYDFDGDGKAEITSQTSLGSVDAKGNYVSKAADPETEPEIYALTEEENETAEFRGYGRITTGQEFLTIFNGETGAAMDTIDLPTERISPDVFGDDFGNRCNRFLSGVAYLDGEKPYAVYWRGYYFGRNGQQRTSVCGVTFDGERLSCSYNFDTLEGQPGYTAGNEIYVGQGNHNLAVADVDDDGKDEILSGAMCLEANDTSDLAVKWCTFKGHGDALHIGNYDPTHKGLEFFTVHEEGDGERYGVTLDYGMSVIDAATGEILFHRGASGDTGRGLMANTGMGGYYQISANENYIAEGNGEFSAAPTSIGSNFRIFWDGDLYDETLNHSRYTPQIYSWNGSRMETIWTAYGCTTVNGTKAVPCLQADLFGDWREELVLSTSDGSALRIYTTTTPTEYKLPTLMHDPVYRSGVAAEQTAYNQPPHIGFYLSEEIYTPDVTALEITKMPDKTVYTVGEQIDISGLELKAEYADGTSGTVTGYVTSGYSAYDAGVQEITLSYGGMTTAFEVEVLTSFIIDENGIITGFDSQAESAILPYSINGTEVKGFADGALKETALKKLTVTSDVSEFGADIFPDGITIECYYGSAIYAYALENSIAVSEIDPRSYTVDLNYDEEDYSGFSMVQGGYSQSQTIGHIYYAVGGRMDKGRPGGDGISGFSAYEHEGEPVLMAGIGQFATSGRYAYFTISDTPALSDSTDSVFETDIYFNDLARFVNGKDTVLHALMQVSDSNGVVDTVSTDALGLESETWYNYKLVYHKGSYYRYISDSDGNLISSQKLGDTDSEYGAVTFTFLQESGDYGKGGGTYILLDNTKHYTNSEISDLTLKVSDSYGDAVPNALVNIGGTERVSDSDGIVKAVLMSGLYTISAKADEYSEKTQQYAVFGDQEINIVLEEEYIPVTGISVEKESITVSSGRTARIKAAAEPVNASNAKISYSSDNEAVAEVLADGTVIAKSEGTAIVTLTAADGAEKTCSVTVTAEGEFVPAELSIVCDSSVSVPSSGAAVRVKLNAVLRDENGAERSADAEWSNDRGFAVEDGYMLIPAGTDSGSVKVTAVCGEITAETSIELAAADTGTVIAEENCETPLDIHMQSEDTSVTIGDITYTIGSRNQGDSSAGFVISDDMTLGGVPCILAKAGRWSDTGRAPIMWFTKAPSEYSQDKTYVFEANIQFINDLNFTYIDTYGNEIYSITPEKLGIDNNVTYGYRLIYSGGEYTQYITDADGKILSCTAPQISGTIGGIKFKYNNNQQNAYIMMSNVKYYETDKALHNVTVRLADSEGNTAAGAVVSIGSIEKTVSDSGKVKLLLPDGVYAADISYNGKTAREYITVSGADVSEYIALAGSERINSVSGAEACVLTEEPGRNIFFAEYNEDGTLAGVSVMQTDPEVWRYTAEAEPDKVFLWDDNMTSIDLWSRQ